MAAAELPTRGSRQVGCWLAGLVLMIVTAFAVWRLRQPSRTDTGRAVVVVVSGDTKGWIVPCGCTSNQSGGLLRRGTYIRDARQRGDVLVLDAGGAPGGTSAYQRLKFEAILQGELALGLDAHNLGGPEAALGADYLRRIGATMSVPFLSANLRDDRGALVAEPLRLMERGGRHLAVVGVLSRRYAGDGLQIDDPREAILRALAGHARKYDALIVLAYLSEEELRQLAANLPEADAVVGGPTGQSMAPLTMGPTLLASATNKGKFLVDLQAVPTDHRLAWSGQVVEMDQKLPDDPQQQENLKRYLADLARRDFDAAETGLAPTLPKPLPKDYRLAGDLACQRCHQQDCQIWRGTHHAHAWQTLTERGTHVDPSCQQCHTSGYGLPGGFASIAQSADAVAVRCESCHGPALSHVRRPATRTPFSARDQCLLCHDRENSPKFDYAQFWSRIQHGPPVAPRNGVKPGTEIVP